MFTLGADPEVFITDSRTGGVVPACDKFGGTKGEPVRLGDLPAGFGLQEDNVMLEFNIPPAAGVWDFVHSINDAREELSRLVRTSGDYDLDKASHRLFSDALLTNSKAREFGCSPDFDAYKMGQPLPPLARDLLREDGGEWRFAGGHVHIGYDTKDNIPAHVVAAFCDAYIGVNVVDLDLQGKRRTFYGSAGRYRPTKYGIEYRTLSNFWIWDENVAQHVANRAAMLGSMLENTPVGVLQRIYVALNWGDIQECINTEDSDMSFSVCDHIREVVESEGATYE